jgi:hypothetical protein
MLYILCVALDGTSVIEYYAHADDDQRDQIV